MGLTQVRKIIRGHEAKPHSRPYMALLQIQTSKEFRRCGGFLVHEDFVLTAAHCSGSSITVTLGAHNVNKQERTWQVIPVRRAIPHPDYDHNKSVNDIMLLQLTRKADMTTVVNPIRLPWRRELVKPGMVCSVASWGRLDVNMPAAEKLQEVELKVQKDKQCSSRYKNYNTTTRICAGKPRKRKRSFKGDSGGPLVCKGVAQGIVSFGNSNGTPPNVYTRISSFLCWIQKIMSYCNLQGPD
ncbi:mast cell protease 1A-like [Hippopotamus amphibius kiboko]|uniref:mast cell protease 1A-like n=1 Tax=Hippopotamus amphibius kiboko TaxID=575201 RepID=UPI0025926EEB|nr:mast cell protease 1A-like [Hippopotamus amphibius kiboko]